MKLLLRTLICGLIAMLPTLTVGQTTPTFTKKARYLALDVHGLTGFHRYRYLEGNEISFRTGGDRYAAPLASVTDSSFSILVENEIMDRTETQTILFRDVDRIYQRKRIPFISQLGVLLPIAGVTYAVADFVNAKGNDGRSGRFLFDSQSLIPAGTMIVAGAIFYKLSRPSYRVGKRNRLRAF
ncbi:MAG: hypothetical protein LH609_14150 [Rudanella sp.]|nr:hypothetical protein [Rudanella sp.]